jgi:hypothetical protein
MVDLWLAVSWSDSRINSKPSPILTNTELGRTYLSVLDNKMPWRQDEGHQRGRKQHLNDSNIVIVARKVLLEGIGMVETETSRST